LPLSTDEERRYSRHLVLPGVGMGGQERLKRARVLLVGAGGLGSPAALYLAAAGIGKLGIADADIVSISNLQRQVLHRTEDEGRLKVDSAADTLFSLNPNVNVIKIPERISADNAMEIISGYDIVVDGTDNFPSRYLLNDACVLSGKPLVFGSIFRFEGQVTVFGGKENPCYRCLFPEPPPAQNVPTCAEGGVLGVLPGIIGSMQAAETLKMVLGIGEPLTGRLLLFDSMDMRLREIRMSKNPDCPLCGEHPTIADLSDEEAYCSVQGPSSDECSVWEMMPDDLRSRLANGSTMLVDVREEWEQEDYPGFPNSLHIPYPIFTRRMFELDSAAEIVLYCSAGARSWIAARMLRRAGFERAWSLRGGLAAYGK
jgi:sulfur-carrier protein adenylyltransferase/sulfurtransferase